MWLLGKLTSMGGSPGGSDGKESTCHVGDLDSVPWLGRYPEGGHGNPLQYSCLKNPYGQRILEGYSPCGGKVSDTTEATYPLQHMDSCTSILSSVQSLIVAGMGQKLHWLEGSRLQHTRCHSCHPSDFQLSKGQSFPGSCDNRPWSSPGHSSSQLNCLLVLGGNRIV